MTSEIQHLLFNSYKLPSPPDGLIPGPLSHLLAETSQMPPLPPPQDTSISPIQLGKDLLIKCPVS